MTVLGTSEISADLVNEVPKAALGEGSEQTRAPASTLDQESAAFEPEASYEELPPESSQNSVELYPQDGKDLVDELSFAENPVAVVDADGLPAMGEAASARGYLWILLARPGPQHRGRLGLYIEETIEQQLEDRGALPPGIHASTGLDASLSDQLYRARLVEMRGIALGIPSLEGITNLGRALDAEDSAVLRWWMASTSDRPVRMVVSRENTRLRVYPSPVLFQSLFEVAPGHVTPIPASPSMAASAASMDLSDLPPSVNESHAETNVFGTEVAGIEEVAEEEDSTQGDQAWFDQDDDVELPDLDVALGLSPPPAVSSATLEPAAKSTNTGAKARLTSRQQLEFEGLDVSPSAPAVESAPAAESAESDAETVFETNDQSESGAINDSFSPQAPQTALVADQAAQVATVMEEPDAAEDVAAVAHETEAFEEAPVSEISRSASDSAPTSSENEDFLSDDLSDDDATDIDDIDTEEFLKTLEEDSARAPSVNAEEVSDAAPVEESAPLEAASVAVAAAPAEEAPAEEAPVEASVAEPTPLPTKTIGRNPFIRLANPHDAVAELPVEAEEFVEASAASALEQDEIEETFDVAADESPADHESDLESKEEVQEQLAPTSEPAPQADPNDPFNQLAAKEWKQWVRNLEAARGPKPLSVIERMFVTDYTRLREAVRRGVAAPSANDILDEWQESFTSSYAEAFDALRVRGKRPTMVLDLPELASRLGRLQGARRVQLLMVDGLRFDLGLMIQERMRTAADASLTERLLLWSALPSVTSYQLELLGKGPDGLKEPGDIDEPPALVARGTAARSPRRVRTGSLELLKLDVVADALRQPGVPVIERMESIADDASAAIVEHLNKQPARTMVIVFGDHGFGLDAAAAGTTEEVKQGGASPEEVLVPAFAWLTGATH